MKPSIVYFLSMVKPVIFSKGNKLFIVGAFFVSLISITIFGYNLEKNDGSILCTTEEMSIQSEVLHDSGIAKTKKINEKKVTEKTFQKYKSCDYIYHEEKDILYSQGQEESFGSHQIAILLQTMKQNEYLQKNISEKDYRVLADIHVETKNFETVSYVRFGSIFGGVFLVYILFFISLPTLTTEVVVEKESKVIEIINTSITSKEYVLSKILIGICNILVLICALLSIVLISYIYAGVAFPNLQEEIKTMISSLGVKSILQAAFQICLGVFILLIVLASLIVFVLSTIITIDRVTDMQGPMFIGMLPVIIVYVVVMIFIGNLELLKYISMFGMFVPIVSPLFLLIYIGFTGNIWLIFFGIIVSIGYIYIIYNITLRIYQYAFYNHDRIGIIKYFKLAVGKDPE